MLTRLTNQINQLYNTYKNDKQTLSKLEHNVMELLPSILLREKKNISKRNERKNTLEHNSDNFIKKFIYLNKYYYCSKNDTYLHYDNINFTFYKEDDIHYNILTTLTNNKHLSEWKHKIKNNIIKQIKNRSIFDVIPETETIQKVLNGLYPNVFESKSEAKYFLTCLGDNILKKNPDLFFIISVNSKQLIENIENVWSSYFYNTNLTSNFKYKFYNHEYKKCRFLKLSKGFEYEYMNPNYNILNLLCVAKHYSDRFKSSEHFLKQIHETDIKNRIGYLKNKTKLEIVNNFVNQSLYSSNGTYVDDKNMLFTWKRYLERINMPNILFSQELFDILKEKLAYDTEKEAFIDVTSNYSPLVENFKEFWNNNFIIDKVNGYEMEISEIMQLHNTKTENVISEELLIQLIKNLYPNINISYKKYIYNIQTILWNKKQDVERIINKIMNSSKSEKPFSLCDLYTYYINCNNENDSINMSKKCFKKIIKKYYNEITNSEEIIQYK